MKREERKATVKRVRLGRGAEGDAGMRVETRLKRTHDGGCEGIGEERETDEWMGYEYADDKIENNTGDLKEECRARKT